MGESIPFGNPPLEWNSTIQRFSGFAGVYDCYRPAPPGALAPVLCRLARTDFPELVVDLGCGTGLSTRYWVGKAKQVIGIDISPDMLAQAEQLLRPGDSVSYREGFSHATGLPEHGADIVTCSQALHWMDPSATFAEAGRIVRAGGVFAAYDYDFPPSTLSWEADLAYEQCMQRVSQFEREGIGPGTPQQWAKTEHARRMKESGCFRYVKEIVLHHVETGNAERLVGVLLSQGSVASLFKKGVSEHELEIDRLREVANRVLGDELSPWYWSSRIRIGVV